MAKPRATASMPAVPEPAAPPPEATAPIDSTALYTLGEASPRLRLGESTLRRLLRTGEIPRRFTTKIGGKLFMTGAQITAVIEYCARADSPTGMVRPHRRRRREVA